MSRKAMYDPLEGVELRADDNQYCDSCDSRPCDGCCRKGAPLHTTDQLVEQAIRAILSNSPDFIEKFRVKFLEALATKAAQ